MRNHFNENNLPAPVTPGGSVKLACSFCGSMAAWDTLSVYGARCFRCYEAYCKEAGSANIVDRNVLADKFRNIVNRKINP
jgi:hypothetical protein